MPGWDILSTGFQELISHDFSGMFLREKSVGSEFFWFEEEFSQQVPDPLKNNPCCACIPSIILRSKTLKTGLDKDVVYKVFFNSGP